MDFLEGYCCVCVCVQLLWQHLYSDRASSLNLDLTACSLCHTGAGGGELRRILTSLYHCARTRHPDAYTYTQCMPAKSSIVVWQEEPRESNSQMCPLALMAASADWRGKTPWRIIHLNSPSALSRDKLIDILRSLAKHARPLIRSTRAYFDWLPILGVALNYTAITTQGRL